MSRHGADTEPNETICIQPAAYRCKAPVSERLPNGVDVGAIKEIYDIILDLVRGGAAVVLVSSSLRETLALSDRVMVIHDGAVVAERPKVDWTYDELLASTLSGKQRHAEATASAYSEDPK